MVLSALHWLTWLCSNSTTGDNSSFSVLTSKYNTARWLGYISWRYILPCVCVHPPLLCYLSIESLTNGYVRAWWSTAIPLLGAKLLQNNGIWKAQRKILFQSTTHNLGDAEKDVQQLTEIVRHFSTKNLNLNFLLKVKKFQNHICVQIFCQSSRSEWRVF